MADWYYIGHYGQLGPLTREQMDELIQDGVISRDTFVWRSGMSDWLAADRCSELSSAFASTDPFVAPPPPPTAPRLAPQPFRPTTPVDPMLPLTNPYGHPIYSVMRSDKNRTMAGILNIILPGVGRIYLGYAAVGALQLVLTFLCGVGWVWSVIDGLVILGGGVKLDGYGRALPE